jgi:glycerate kinase
VRSGFDVVAEALRLEERIAAADLVITGEGRLDDQTLDGKGPAGIAALARLYKKPVLGFAGSVADLPELRDLFDLTCPIVDEVVKLDEAMRRGAEFLERAAFRTARALYLGTTL